MSCLIGGVLSTRTLGVRVDKTCVHPLTFEDTPGYTLLAPPVAGSPCNLLYHLYITKRLFNVFRNSGVTFEVLNCTKFQIFRGSAPDPAGELTALPGPPSC